MAGKILALDGDIETAGAKLKAPTGLPGLFADFVQWQPQPPKSAPALAELTAQLCRLLREEAVALGAEVIWLHTFGERYADPSNGRAASAPRMPKGKGPLIPRDGAIPSAPERMPDRIDYDAGKHRLLVGEGFIDNVSPEVWQYEVSGKQVLVHWFSYRKKDRTRAVIGERRPPSPLENIQPDHWLAEYTTELLNVLHVLGRLVTLESHQADLLTRICAGPLISVDTLRTAGAFDVKRKGKGGNADARQDALL